MTNCRASRLVLVPLACVLNSACGDSKTPVTWWDAGAPDGSVGFDAGQMGPTPDAATSEDAGSACAQIQAACAGSDDVDGLGNLCSRAAAEGDAPTCDAVLDECLPYCAGAVDAGIDAGHLDEEHCEAMGDTCHDFDTGSGLGHWCHEVGHSGNVAWCAAIYDDCTALCGEPIDHGHEEDAGERVELTLNFAAKFGAQDFACGRQFADVGVSHSTVTPLDLRFYVSNIRLLTEEGEQVPVDIDDIGPYQGGGVALLDFTDAQGSCTDNNTPINTTVRVSAPSGHYTGVAFSTGVPEESNHQDPLTLPAPFQFTDMWWGWVAGFRFLKLELQTVVDVPDAAGTGGHSTTIDTAVTLDAGGDSAVDAGYPSDASALDAALQTQSESITPTEDPSFALFHLGSVACSAAESDAGGGDFGAISCAKPNRNEVVLSEFDIAEDVVVFDVAAVVAQADLSESVLCHPGGASCVPLFEAVGVDYETGSAREMQSAFRIE